VNRKEAILKAAIQLFAERGFHVTATSEVAKRAGVAEGTIFHHFKTKEGILRYIFDEMMDVYVEGIKTRLIKGISGLDAIEELIRFHFRFSEERSEELTVVIRDFPFRITEPGSPLREVVTSGLLRVTNIIRECIEMGQKDGSIRDISPTEAAFTIQGMLNGLSRFKLLGHLTVPDLSEQVVDFCLHGLARLR